MRKIFRWLVVSTIMLISSIGILNMTAMAEKELPKSEITLSPTKDKQELEPGQTFNGSFSIANTGAEPFDFRVFVKPLSVGADCTEQYEVDNDWTLMSQWVNLEINNYYDVQPGDKRTVNFNVDVPKDAPSGGQYVIIFAETGKMDQNGSTAIQVNQRVGYKFYADLGGENKEAGQVESVGQRSLFWEPPISGYSKVRNTGNVDFTEEHTMTVIGLDGKEVYSNSSTADVLPDTCRRINQDWPKTPAFGIFWVEHKIEFLGSEQYSNKKLVVVIPIYIVVIFAIMIVLLVWALVLKIRKDGVKFEAKKKSKSGEES